MIMFDWNVMISNCISFELEEWELFSSNFEEIVLVRSTCRSIILEHNSFNPTTGSLELGLSVIFMIFLTTIVTILSEATFSGRRTDL